MKYLTTLVLVAFVGVACVQANSIITQARSDNALFNYLMQSSATLTNPTLSRVCFTKHLPILSEIAQKFSKQYQACMTLANNRTAIVAMQAMQTRAVLVQDITAMCSAYQSCEHEKAVLDFFNCYASVCSQDVDLIKNISNKATFSAHSYSQSLQLIQDDSVKCTNASEHAYIRDTAAAYKLLDNCLQHGLSEDVVSTSVASCEESYATEASTTETTEAKENTDQDSALNFIIQATMPGRTHN